MPVTRKRSPAVASTSAGTSFDAKAAEAGAHIATPATSRKRPSASLVEPGLRGERDETDRGPDAAEKAHSGGGHAVAGEEAEERGRELERHGEREDAERDLLALGRFDPAELEPRHDERRRGEPEEAERERARDRPQRDARARDQLLSRRLLRRSLGHPTTSACGAPVLIRVMNHFACGSVSAWHSVASASSSGRARPLPPARPSPR